MRSVRSLKAVRFVVAATLAAVAALVLAACGSSSGTTTTVREAGGASLSGRVVVFAAASLRASFDKIASEFENAHPGVHVTFNYAGSSTLAESLKQGAPADLFASANTTNMDIVTDANLASGMPKIFARNEAEIMVEPNNPKDIKTVQDLAKSSLKVVLCAPDVPCGSLAKKIFENAGVTVNPVSEETSVSGVVTKIGLGEADAGIVYVTDVKAAGDKGEGVAIPSHLNEIAKYPIVELKDAPNSQAATAFESFVLGQEGQKVLDDFGFLPPES